MTLTQEMPAWNHAGFSMPDDRRQTGEVNIDKEVAALRRTTVNELRARYAEVFGEQTKVRHKEWLVRRIVWRLQAVAEGDLS